MEDQFDNTSFLRKYAPKYYTKVDYDLTLSLHQNFSENNSFIFIVIFHLNSKKNSVQNFCLAVLLISLKKILEIFSNRYQDSGIVVASGLFWISRFPYFSNFSEKNL